MIQRRMYVIGPTFVYHGWETLIYPVRNVGRPISSSAVVEHVATDFSTVPVAPRHENACN